MDANQKTILEYWYAYIYEQQEDATWDVPCLLRHIGDEPQRILEVACGGGRLSVPMALAGHDVTGFDLDEAMLARVKPTPNLRVYRADALVDDWGEGFDVCVMGANLMINIVTDADYEQAQRAFLRKAHDCVRPGGHVYLDFDVIDWPDEPGEASRERTIFEGVDDRGTYGRAILVSGRYDSRTRVGSNKNRCEITTRDGATFEALRHTTKRFPTLDDVCGWLGSAGLTIERLYGGHDGEAFDEGHRRAVIWAKRR